MSIFVTCSFSISELCRNYFPTRCTTSSGYWCPVLCLSLFCHCLLSLAVLSFLHVFSHLRLLSLLILVMFFMFFLLFSLCLQLVFIFNSLLPPHAHHVSLLQFLFSLLPSHLVGLSCPVHFLPLAFVFRVKKLFKLTLHLIQSKFTIFPFDTESINQNIRPN